MKENIKTFFHISWASSLYFILLALESYGVIKIDLVLFGVIRELITLPLLGLQLVLFVWTLIYIIKDSESRKSYMLYTFLIALVNTAVVIYSFL
ncbi:MAG: hypothetical protein KAY27_00660 [Pedobacter sp.]|nr:hypothetical protein [Pedobacter sp.]